jgi:hypothetical protein
MIINVTFLSEGSWRGVCVLCLLVFFILRMPFVVMLILHIVILPLVFMCCFSGFFVVCFKWKFSTLFLCFLVWNFDTLKSEIIDIN